MITPVIGDYPDDLAYDPVTQTVYGIRFHFQSSTGQLLSVNLTTGVNTQIGSDFDLIATELTFSIISQDGVAYFAGRSSTIGSADTAIYTVTLASGAVSLSAPIDFTSITPSLRHLF